MTNHSNGWSKDERCAKTHKDSDRKHYVPVLGANAEDKEPGNQTDTTNKDQYSWAFSVEDRPN